MKYKHLKILNLISILFCVVTLLYLKFQLNQVEQSKNDLERQINNLDSTTVLYIDTLVQE